MKSATGNRLHVAVFPLLDGVLFPGVTLPLSVGEDRYEHMVREVQARGWPLAVSLVEPGSSTTNDLAFNAICGAGDIHLLREHANGHSEILIHGTQRVRLCSFLQQEPYLIMEAEVIPTQTEGRAQSKFFSDFRELVKMWAFLNPRMPPHLMRNFDDFSSLGLLCDYFVFHFLKEAPEKQTYLNCLDPLQRAEMLARVIEKEIRRFRQKLRRGEVDSRLLH